MANGAQKRSIILLAAGSLLLAICGFLLLCLSNGGWAKVTWCYDLLHDRQKVQNLVTSSGGAAPLILIGLHISQVLLAPIPGDAFCWLGGYLFGALNGFLLSTVGMTIGSVVNFSIGRLLGERLVRRLVSAPTYDKYDALVRSKGGWLLFLLFLVPGFPKDVLCLLLGVTSLPIRVFIVLSMIARMPTTAAFSLQGAAFFSKDYVLFATLCGVCTVVAAAAFLSRDAIRRWLERQYQKNPGGTMP